MQEVRWLGHLPNKTLEGGIELLNELAWNIKVEQNGDLWAVSGGECTLLITSSRDAVDAFLYGLALAYRVIPDDILNQFRRVAYDATH
jgi:hypothetical protein